MACHDSVVLTRSDLDREQTIGRSLVPIPSLCSHCRSRIGAWEVANGRESFGLGLIAIAVVDVLVVGALRLYRARHDRQQ